MSNTNKTVRNITPEEMAELELKNTTTAQSETFKQKEDNVNPFEPKPFEFKLPSGNLIVPSGSILVRRLTTVEESLFQNKMQYIYNNSDSFDNLSATFELLKTFSEIIQLCVKNVDIYDLSLIDKIPLFLYIMGLTYGFTHKFKFKCEECGNVYEHKVDLQKIKINYVPADFEYPKSIDLKYDFPVKINLIYPSIADEAIWDNNSNILSKFLSMLQDANGTLPNGDPITEEHYDDIIKNLDPDDKQKIKKFIEEFSHFGNNGEIKLKVCKNVNCSRYKKTTMVTIPIYDLFEKMF